MQLPIPLGTILQNRYYLLDLSNQHQLYRKYLAKDTQEQNKLCIIHELIVNELSKDAVFLQRFQDELLNLYAIHHPQIPEYLTSFEEDNRLFLIEKYIEGKSYLTLLTERNLPFSETEVINLLVKILPVLEYLHNLGIAHGQIAPENIIIPNDNTEPVLINLSALSKLMAQLLPQEITPDKDNFSAQTDLYDLAITALILLTGLPKAQLLDVTNQLRWDWQNFSPISTQFAQILTKTLSYQPGEPYHSAQELHYVLQTINKPSEPTIEPAAEAPTPIIPPRPQKPTPKVRSWGNPWAYLWSILLVVGVWLGIREVLKQLLNPDELSQPQEEPVVLKPTPTPSAPAKNNSKDDAIDLNLSAEGKASIEGTLTNNQNIRYKIRTQPWQKLNINLTPSDINFSLLNPNNQTLVEQVKTHTELLTSSGDYILQLKPTPKNTPGKYQLAVKMSPYFPQKICQESQNSQDKTWYPVLVEYSQESLSKIQQDYCRNTFLTFNSQSNTPTVQVATFVNQEKATAFAELMKTQVGNSEVGKPTPTPKTSCSDGDAQNIQTLHSVYVEYTRETYNQILSYCPTASVVDRPAIPGSYIEIATFREIAQAQQLAEFLNKQGIKVEVSSPNKSNN